MAVGLAAYWPQFPGMYERVGTHHQQLLRKFPHSSQIIDAGMVDSVDKSIQSGAVFQSKDVDVVFVQLTTYSNAETLLPAVKGLNVPVVLLNLQSVPVLPFDQITTIDEWLGTCCTCAGLPEMTSVLMRSRKRFDTITGFLEGDVAADQQIYTWCQVAGLHRRLKAHNLALLGRPYPGMMDLYVDETRIYSEFGTYIHHLQWQDVIDATLEVDDASAALAELTHTFPSSDAIDSSTLREAAKVLSAFERLSDKYQLCAIPNHFEGPTTSASEDRLLSVLNPVLSVMNTRGIACPVEGDIKTALAMVILKTLGGSATLAELYSMDFQADVCIIGHSGAGDAAISNQPPQLRTTDVFHGKSGGGLTTQFTVEPGPVTLLSLGQDETGGFTLIVAEGECVEGPLLTLGDTNARIQFSCGVRNFVNRWSQAGPTHHGVLGHGHLLESLRKAAILLNLPLHVICEAV